MGKLKSRRGKPKLTAEDQIELMLTDWFPAMDPKFVAFIRDNEPEIHARFAKDMGFYEAAKTATEAEIRALWGANPHPHRGLIAAALRASRRGWLHERLLNEEKNED